MRKNDESKIVGNKTVNCDQYKYSQYFIYPQLGCHNFTSHEIAFFLVILSPCSV